MCEGLEAQALFWGVWWQKQLCRYRGGQDGFCWLLDWVRGEVVLTHEEMVEACWR